MATTKKNTRAKKSAKEQTKRVEPDLSLVLDENGNFVLDLYDHGEYASGKITACDVLVVYVKVVTVPDEEYAFISFPSYYKEGKRGRKGEYINQAFFIDKDIIQSMNEAVTNYCFGE